MESSVTYLLVDYQKHCSTASFIHSMSRKWDLFSYLHFYKLTTYLTECEIRWMRINANWHIAQSSTEWRRDMYMYHWDGHRKSTLEILSFYDTSFGAFDDRSMGILDPQKTSCLSLPLQFFTNNSIMTTKLHVLTTDPSQWGKNRNWTSFFVTCPLLDDRFSTCQCLYVQKVLVLGPGPRGAGGTTRD